MYEPLPTSTAIDPTVIPDGVIELISGAWNRLKTWPAPAAMGILIGIGLSMAMMMGLYFVIFIGAAVVGLVVGGVGAAMELDQDTMSLVMSVGFALVALVMYPLIFIGMLVGQLVMFRGALATARGETLGPAELFTGIPRKAVSAAGAGLLITLAMIPAVLLLYFPALYLGLRWSLTFHYLVDTQLGAINAMKASWRATEGKVLDLFLKNLGVGVITGLATILTCYIGGFVALPVQMIVLSMVYVKLSGRTRSGMPDPEIDVATY